MLRLASGHGSLGVPLHFSDHSHPPPDPREPTDLGRRRGRLRFLAALIGAYSKLFSDDVEADGFGRSARNAFACGDCPGAVRAAGGLQAELYRGAPLAGGGGALLVPGVGSVRELLRSRDLTLAHPGNHRGGVVRREIDRRLVELLQVVVRPHRITITALKSDQPLDTASGAISSDAAGRAADSGVADGERWTEAAEEPTDVWRSHLRYWLVVPPRRA